MTFSKLQMEIGVAVIAAAVILASAKKAQAALPNYDDPNNPNNIVSTADRSNYFGFWAASQIWPQANAY